MNVTLERNSDAVLVLLEWSLREAAFTSPVAIELKLSVVIAFTF